ncbi:hypothetical protein GGTG_11448 [Gaeumannomyces tritici R3-111a-1]|uniref:DUF8035 domain-containing protein n=1 Tax=Gaeumannomyces tritici (strain R3-111a-1) TaxID=644352 RepID=J3PD79_GAET3|nr:hypothetical protein GGTG_11448 [Gaeumannomyces tritici R3-111a-1]EJT70424.1 hypothetical protein GGTG_11448 [Gaeumannomyces tritici R3-111a-1]
MADRRDFYDDRDTFYTTGSGAPPQRRGGGSEANVYERFEEVRREEGPTRSRVQVRERERERDDDSRLPNFLRDERRGPVSAAPADTSGAMVLRQREIETVSRPRPRSPSQVRFEERTQYVRRARSPSPSMVSEPLPPPRRERVEIRQFERRRSPSPHPIRGRSPSHERERIRIIERSRSRERIPSPSPSPPPPPAPAVPEVIRGPTIEREVITHYRNIDHGVVQARPPPPPSPAPRPILKQREVEITRDTDIDITRTRGRNEVDINIRRRSVSRERGALVVAKRRSPSPEPLPARRTFDDFDHRHKLRVDIDDRHRSTSVSAEHTHHGHRRSHSALPDYRDESERITSRIDARGRNGEAYGGATRDWTIVDVPPGTERVRMEGAGGGAADVTWERYSGVRRARFVPERDSESNVSSNTTTVTSERPRERVVETNDRLNISVSDKNHEIEIEKTSRGRAPRRPKATEDMWTEITKDLVIREAIEEMGYDYEERGPFFYIMQYLQYEDVLQLVQLTDDIRRHRRRHLREIEYERETRDNRHRRRSSKYDYDRELVVGVDREVVYDRPPVRGYLS